MSPRKALDAGAPAFYPSYAHALTQPDPVMAAPTSSARAQNHVLSDSSTTTQDTTSTQPSSIMDSPEEDTQHPSSPEADASADTHEVKSPSPASPRGQWQEAGADANLQAMLESHQITLPQWKTETYRCWFNVEMVSPQFPRVDTVDHFKRFYAAYPHLDLQRASQEDLGDKLGLPDRGFEQPR
ncbi:hypothetical protein Slin14017_G123140 [Septoria linicola]|nr:hypothetical protein Slin14017_G123140 [Septoria linicola]